MNKCLFCFQDVVDPFRSHISEKRKEAFHRLILKRRKEFENIISK